jgi:hypothetical protein
MLLHRGILLWRVMVGIAMIAIVFVLSLTFQIKPEPRTPPPLVTIKVTQDVSLEPYQRDKEEKHVRGVLQFFHGGKQVTIRRGQTFQVVSNVGQMEGGCRIRFQKVDYEIASCFWRQGFADHQSDIFVIVKN